MYPLTHLGTVDYLVIGHLTRDLVPGGERLGGTVTYAGLMARALGLRVGIITSWGADMPIGPLSEIPIVNLPAEHTTTFENISTPEGRIQLLSNVAHNLNVNLIPEVWLNSPLVHLGPVAQEVEPSLVRHFSNSFIGLTPQGWLRTWDQAGRVSACEWPEASFVLRNAGAAVISAADVEGDENRIEELASSCRVLAITEDGDGVRLFWNGDVRRFRAPTMREVDSVGAGDIFAAAFFYRLYTTRDPWEAARFATHLASISVTRLGLAGIPTAEEIQECMAEVI